MELDTPVPDAELVRAAAAGDAAAWHAIVRRYEPLLRSIARSHRLAPPDAADAAQLTWLRLVEHLDRINDPDRLPGWLATTARRECLQILRRAGREQPALGDELFDVPADSEPVDHRLLAAERAAALRHAVDTIPAGLQRLVRALLEAPTPSYAAMAATLGVPIGSVGPTRRRALDALRTRLVAAQGA